MFCYLCSLCHLPCYNGKKKSHLATANGFQILFGDIYLSVVLILSIELHTNVLPSLGLTILNGNEPL